MPRAEWIDRLGYVRSASWEPRHCPAAGDDEDSEPCGCRRSGCEECAERAEDGRRDDADLRWKQAREGGP